MNTPVNKQTGTALLKDHYRYRILAEELRERGMNREASNVAKAADALEKAGFNIDKKVKARKLELVRTKERMAAKRSLSKTAVTKRRPKLSSKKKTAS